MTQPLDHHTPSPKSSTLQIVAILAAWFVGVELWFNTDWWLVRSGTHLAIYAAAVALCFFRPFREGLLKLCAVLDRRGRFVTPLLFVAASALAIAILYLTADYSHRKFSPVMHDEFSYLLQAMMLAHGHLSMPAHPLGAFFDTFYVITDRAYASQYFPGAAMMFVPGVWLGLDGWVMPLVIAGATAGMMFLVIRELFDGLCGLASVILLCGVLGFRFLSLVPVAQVPALLLGLTATFAMLRWVATRHAGWIVACGAAIGWMAITRPLDAVVYALPLGALFIYTQVRAKADAKSWRRLVTAGLLPLLPFLALQIAINYRVTGQLLKTPFSYYAQRDLPGTSYGFHAFDPSLKPASTLPQKQKFYETNVMPMLADHTPIKVAQYWIKNRAKTTAGEMVGDMLLFIPVPVGLLCLRDPRRWAVVSVLLVWCIAYSFYSFMYAHYYVAVLPSVPVLIFAGFESIGRLIPRSESVVKCARALLPLAVVVLAMPQFKRDVKDQFVDAGLEEPVRTFEKTLVGVRSILLVRCGIDSPPEWEVVYNINNAWPDDAAVIRAHDLGDEKNLELFRYYAERQPDRDVYRYDRETSKFERLGNVAKLAETSGEKRDSISNERPAATEDVGTLTTKPASQP